MCLSSSSSSPAAAATTLVAVNNILQYLLHFRRYSNGAVYRGQGRIDGKVVIVTGANSGIGKETALDLVNRGQHSALSLHDLHLFC